MTFSFFNYLNTFPTIDKEITSVSSIHIMLTPFTRTLLVVKMWKFAMLCWMLKCSVTEPKKPTSSYTFLPTQHFRIWYGKKLPVRPAMTEQIRISLQDKKLSRLKTFCTFCMRYVLTYKIALVQHHPINRKKILLSSPFVNIFAYSTFFM